MPGISDAGKMLLPFGPDGHNGLSDFTIPGFML
jgi:hypothetical protein